MGSIGHVFSGFFASAACFMLTASLTDGQSFAKRKNPGDITWNGSLSGVIAKEDYGIGLYHDVYGQKWEDRQHYLHSCSEYEDRGLAMFSFAVLGLICAAFTALFNLLGAQSGNPMFGLAAVGSNAALAVFLVIAVSLAASIYDEVLDCFGSTFRVKDVMDVNYAMPFMSIAGFFAVVSILVLFVTEATTSSESPEAGEADAVADAPAGAAAAPPADASSKDIPDHDPTPEKAGGEEKKGEEGDMAPAM
eukprot:TRINITY_DN33602_c0_g2_i1.p1 TRINITY_DN33602_c0_g2~~TRINITY_DN33602_c0_g2_i1.p1  ORF type:complete len:249 (+),score=93.29 TRINITY_DN33602_c0_g2_i1:48-794(+)